MAIKRWNEWQDDPDEFFVESEVIENEIEGKTIKSFYFTHSTVFLSFTDGTTFNYEVESEYEGHQTDVAYGTEEDYKEFNQWKFEQEQKLRLERMEAKKNYEERKAKGELTIVEQMCEPYEELIQKSIVGENALLESLSPRGGKYTVVGLKIGRNNVLEETDNDG
jgi:uncharacterized membrane protein YqiK